MANPWVHSESSAKKWGGKPEDYYAIHETMDSTKQVVADNRHRLIFHTTYGACKLIPMIFGPTITNSDGNKVSTKDIAERHILEDFGHKFIPTLQDYVENMTLEHWMNNGRVGTPPSYRRIEETQKEVKITTINSD